MWPGINRLLDVIITQKAPGKTHILDVKSFGAYSKHCALNANVWQLATKEIHLMRNTKF